MIPLPGSPPFALRARLLSPLADGGFLDEPDGILEIDAGGRIGRIGRMDAWPGAEAPASVLDLRPLVLLPGMVDLHAHLPQIPNAGLGSGLDLLTWLDRYIFPLERADDRSVAERQAPAAFQAFAAAGTTTVASYAALWADSTDAAFAAAEQHGIRAVIGKVMMDRLTYDTEIRPSEILEKSLRQSDELATRWHGRDEGRLSYAFTPRFAARIGRRTCRRIWARSTRSDGSSPTRGTTSTCTTGREPSGRRRSWRTRSTLRGTRSIGSLRAGPGSRTARHRTSSCRAG